MLDVRKGIIDEIKRVDKITGVHNTIYLDKYNEIMEKIKLVPQNFPNIINIENPLLGITANFTSDKSDLLVKFLNIINYYKYRIQENTNLHASEIYMNEVTEYKQAIISILSNPNLDLNVINNMSSLEDNTLKLFFLIVVIGDNDFTNLYLNLMNPYLTNDGLIEVNDLIGDNKQGKKIFKQIINEMKKPPIRKNFPNITRFPS